ncbi:CLUMA_CG004022, isoform A [Clunio marinus]|uniref:Elongation of very long chain fatty acids protein n=1 Tax=Clunio marinus TaxID=568069 RepID=A0A1J1HQZ3_9DIPT|nr:CLUMA_CG004022, isoform A [Clunio marinus]
MSSIKEWFMEWQKLIESQTDQRTKHFFMMSSPLPTIYITLCYLLFVLYIGPKIMENRKPYNIRKIIIVHNLIQVILNAKLFYDSATLGWFSNYNWRCEPYDRSPDGIPMKLTMVAYYYYLSKFTDLLDTIFFILRKRNDQVSALHVIHHGIMPLGVYFGIRFASNGHGSFFGFLNTFIHVVMYTYYMLAAFGPKMKKYLWWKRYLTIMQMVQFIAIIIHSSQLFFHNPCEYPMFYAWYIIVKSLVFLLLFRAFYKKSYCSKELRIKSFLKEKRIEKLENVIKSTSKRKQIMRPLANIYEVWRDLMDNKSDPRVKNWFMMSSPLPTICISLTYVLLVKSLGPKLMKYRKPYELRKCLIIYNFIQVAMSVGIFYYCCKLGWLTTYNWRCEPFNTSPTGDPYYIVVTCYCYYLSKFTELLDTIFFIMRKRYDQVSILHVIHHGIMPVSVWFGVKLQPGGHATFFGFLNSGVHIVMYAYYMLAAIGPQMQKYLWWKKYLTLLQMVQFVAVFIHSMQLFVSNPCQYPIIYSWIVALHAVMFFLLFKAFYKKSYVKKEETDKIINRLYTAQVLSPTSLKEHDKDSSITNRTNYQKLKNHSINNRTYHKRLKMRRLNIDPSMMRIFNNLHAAWLDLLENKSDQRNKDWFMMSSPFPTLLVIFIYVYIVKFLGPKLMENRKPFQFRKIIIFYNLTQVLLSGKIFYDACTLAWLSTYSWRCEPLDSSTNDIPMRIVRSSYLYYLSKFTELLDTIFFVLRKRNDQVSTLHVIHHGIMPLSVWWGCKVSPGGHGTFFGFLNSGVHIVMYTYYMLAAIGPHMQKYLWWKKYLTLLQMGQFVAIIIHSTQLFFYNPCDYPLLYSYVLLFHCLLFLFLFGAFYKQSYTKQKIKNINYSNEKKFDGEKTFKSSENALGKVEGKTNGRIEDTYETLNNRGYAKLGRQDSAKLVENLMRLLNKINTAWVDFMDNKTDPRVKDWFMMSSPFPTFFIVFIYVYIVKFLGPKLMENRKPFQLRKIIIFYNFIQVLISAKLFYDACTLGWLTTYNWRCEPLDRSTSDVAMKIVRGCYFYYLSKFTELLDTIFFVMRKRYDQVSTLHVIHHGIMPISVWWGLKLSPGGHGTFFGFLNTGVHVIMYTYYMLAAIGPHMQKYLWWKKYLTLLQIIQFVGVIIHSVQLFFHNPCKYPIIYSYFLLGHAFMFLSLFSAFYKQSYIVKKDRRIENLHDKTFVNHVKCENMVASVKYFEPPNGGYGWIVVIGGLLINMFNQSILSLFGLIFGGFFNNLNASKVRIALVMNLCSVFLNLTGLITAPLLKIYSPRQIAVCGSLFASVGLMLSSLASELFHIIFTYSFMVGVGLGLITPSIFMAISPFFTTKKARAISMSMAGTGLGQMLLPQIVRVLQAEYGSQMTILILGSMSMHGIVGALLFRSMGHHKMRIKRSNNECDEQSPLLFNASNSSDDEAENSQNENVCTKIFDRIYQLFDFSLLKSSRFLFLNFGLASVYTVSIDFQLILPFFLQETVNLNTNQTAVCMSVLAAFDLISRLTFPFILEPLKFSSRSTLMMGIVALGIVRSVLAELTDYTSLLIACAFFGYFRALTVVNHILAVSEYCSENCPAKLPGALGLNMIIKGVAVITIGPIFGWIRDLTSSYILSFHSQNILMSIVLVTWIIESSL